MAIATLLPAATACGVLLGLGDFDDGDAGGSGGAGAQAGTNGTAGKGGTGVGGGGAAGGGTAGSGTGGSATPVDPCIPPTTANLLCGDGEALICNCMDDEDCDGLLGQPQDPWPSDNNDLLFIDNFSSGQAANWLLTGTPTPANGWISIDVGDTLTLKPLCSAAFLTPAVLVEIGFSLESVSDADDWRVSLRAAHGDGDNRRCHLWRDPPTTQDGAIMWSMACSEGTSDADCTPAEYGGNVVKDAVSKAFILQSWSMGSFSHCRLLSADGATALSATSGDHVANEEGTIAVATHNASIRLHYVRVYEPGL